jgi:hypothetical protein
MRFRHPVLLRRLGLMLLAAAAPDTGRAAYQLPAPTGLQTSFPSDAAFLDYVGQHAFKYFWSTQNAATGLVADRASNPALASIAATGFGLSCINTAIERGWISRADGRARVLTTLQTLASLPQGSAPSGVAGYRGWFYHFLDSSTGLRSGTSELSTVDTAWLMLGVLDCGLFFNDATDPSEASIRQLSQNLLNGLDWTFVLRPDNRITMSWDPVTGFNADGWSGYNEAMALYLLGLGAANNPLPAASWDAWASTYRWSTFFSQSYVWTTTGSLFTDQYSHCFVDFRGITDAYLRSNGGGIDYFENSRRATYAQQAYAVTQPFRNYSSTEFGITACDGPNATIGGVSYAGYAGRGAPPGPPVTLDDGTLAPSAVLGSLPFAPEICIPAAQHLYGSYLAGIWSDYGFCDAFNVTAQSWFDPDVVGIDAGPSILMIDNYLSGDLWARMLGSPVIQLGLQRAGFTAPPPDNVIATAASGTQINVSWTTRSNYESGFVIEISTDGTDFSVGATAGPGATAASLAVQPGTTCAVRVLTNSAAGLSGSRQTVWVTTPSAVALAALPASIVVADGQAAALSVAATGSGPLTYQWYFDGSPLGDAEGIDGSAGSTLLLTGAGARAGSYACLVSNALGSVLSTTASLVLEATSDAGRLINVSCRGMVGEGANQMILGFYSGGAGASGTETVLIRASGPALSAFGVGGVLPDPKLILNQSNADGSSTVLSTNAGWEGSAQVASTAAAVGAFAWLSEGSLDSALVSTLSGGAYTVETVGASGDSGIALAEVYDATPAGSLLPTSPRLINISVRDQVGTGGGILIGGFAIGGSTAKTVLIRASGPALNAFGIPGTLPDPHIGLYQSNGDGTSTLLCSNGGWGGSAQIAMAAARVGAFPWGSAPTADSAILVTLPPGDYTAQVAGASGDTGVALLEVYEVQ